MGRLTLSLIRRFRQWERSAQIAAVLALILLVVVMVVAANSPQEFRPQALVGIMALLLVLQAIVLWANRDLVTPYTQAQRHYLQGDFASASAILEGLRQSGQADVRELTLLGNTYRQMARLEDSEAVLREAIEKVPDHHFPLAGLGRTQLVMGRYADAVTTLQAALKAGAPNAVQADLGEALYRSRQLDAAKSALQAVDSPGEDWRALMTVYLLHRLGAGIPPSSSLLISGLPYWKAAVERFQHTPYGAEIAADVVDMQTHRT